MCNKTIAFDLDDVLCFRESEEGDIEKYNHCKPIPQMIKILNNCYEDGYKVIIYTSRGMSVFKGNISDIYTNLYELTLNQLNIIQKLYLNKTYLNIKRRNKITHL